MIDFVPGPSGIIGQLITNKDECEYVVLANNVTELIKNYVALLDKGVLKIRKKVHNSDVGYELYNPNENYFDVDEMAVLFKKYT